MAIRYEWDCETIDPASMDVVSHLHGDLVNLPWSEPHTRIVLVRDVGNDEDGLLERHWAYVDPGSKMLPSHFADECGNETLVRVPQKFHREIALAAQGRYR